MKSENVEVSLSELFEMQTDVYKSMDLSDIWPDKTATYYWTNNNFLATYYANILVKIIVKSSKPVNIIEIGSGFGRFSYLLIKRIKEHFDNKTNNFRYIMTDISSDLSQRCKTHPKFQQFIKDGILEFSVLDIYNLSEAKLFSGKKLGTDIENHCNIVISNFVFSDLSGDLFTMRSGKLHKSFLNFERDTLKSLNTNFTQTLKKTKIQFSHHAIDSDFYSSEQDNYVLKHYKKDLKEGSFVNPTPMYSFFDFFEEISSSFYWLITDEANSSLEEFVNAKPKFYRMKSGMVTNPINMHALQYYVNNKGYDVVKRDVPYERLDTYLITQKNDTQNKTLECDINTFNVNDYIMYYKRAYKKLSTQRDLLVLIRLSNHDPQVLEDFFNYILKITAKGDTLFRNTLKQYLNKCWDNYYSVNSETDMAYMIARVFHNLNMHGEAIHYYQLSVKKQENEDNLLNMGRCFHDIGFYKDAKVCYKELSRIAIELPSTFINELILTAEDTVQNTKQTGMFKIDSKDNFDNIAYRNTMPGFANVLQCKFIITHINTEAPIIYFTDSNQYEFHYKFYCSILGYNVTEKIFDDVSYYKNEDRINIGGSIVVHPNIGINGKESIYTLDFWPVDPVLFEHVKLSWDLIREKIPFLKDKLYYHLSSQIQLKNYENEKNNYLASDIKTISTDSLFSNFSMIPLNIGSTYGILRILGAESETDMDDIVVYKTLPNELSNVRGVITEEPQTPLSHINLKAIQNSIPNACIKNASKLDEILSFNGKPVFFEVTGDGYTIKKASNDEIKMRSNISAQPRVVPLASYKQKEIYNLDNITKKDSIFFGAKASNMAEMNSFMDKINMVKGFSIPFYFYQQFLILNNLEDSLIEMLSSIENNSNNNEVKQILKSFRQTMMNSEIPTFMMEEINQFFSKDKQLNYRLRSSSNNEDLANFSGAGLYDSVTYNPSKVSIADCIKKVWSSLWSYRAFQERKFHSVENNKVSMGILVHESHDNEMFNGIIVTKNIYSKYGTGCYINVQLGSSLVTNPDKGAVPEEIMVTDLGTFYDTEVHYHKYSNLTSEIIMSKDDVLTMYNIGKKIHNHFKPLYENNKTEKFAMEIEFLKNKNGDFIILQARPWVN